MKDYNEIEITRENYEEVMNDILADLNELLVGETIKCFKYGDGTIEHITKIGFSGSYGEIPVGIETTILFGEEIKTFVLNVGLKTKFLSLPNTDVIPTINEFLEVLDKVYKIKTEIEREESATKRELAERKRAEEARLQKEAQLKQRLQSRQEKVILDLNKIKKGAKSTENDFYTDLGWMAKHVGAVSAQIPDYLENWFIQRFGTEAPKSVISSLRRTTGGYAMKWNPSFSISFKKVDAIPESIQKYVTKNKINNTAFVFDLIENYGFAFGRKQNVDKILSCVPTSKKEQFELGLTT